MVKKIIFLLLVILVIGVEPGVAGITDMKESGKKEGNQTTAKAKIAGGVLMQNNTDFNSYVEFMLPAVGQTIVQQVVEQCYYANATEQRKGKGWILLPTKGGFRFVNLLDSQKLNKPIKEELNTAEAEGFEEVQYVLRC